VEEAEIREKYCWGVEEGWFPLIIDLVKDLLELGWDGQLCQVKEKFGGLRFYIGFGSKEIFNRIHKAEAKSFKICEECGEPGKLRKNPWIKTLCDIHQEEYERKMVESFRRTRDEHGT